MTKLLIVCQPLLDVIATVKPEFLEKWGLEKNNAILAEEKHQDLLKEVESTFECGYASGGAGQNSIRIAQWMLQEEGATTMIGSAAEDKYAQIMKDEAKRVGMHVEYYTGTGLPTGTCCVLVNGANRSMVTYLSASSKYDNDHLLSKDIWKRVEEAEIFYFTGFFHAVRFDTMDLVAKHANDNNKIFAINLSAPFLLFVPFFFEAFKKLHDRVDIFFGNEFEFAELAKAYGWEYKELKEVCVKLALMFKSDKIRTVVMTQGPEPSVVVKGNHHGITYEKIFEVIPIADSDICDTTGCGDAYVGGFLAGLAKGATVEECVRAGNYAANVVIKRLGCSVPDKPEFTFQIEDKKEEVSFDDVNVQDAATKRGCLCW